MKTLTFSSFFMLFFLVAAFALAVIAMPSSLGSVESVSIRTILNGKWTPEFEKKFTEKLAVYNPSRLLWGTAEYELFDDGRSGVVIGQDGWLFTAEEFQTSRKAPSIYKEHVDYIAETGKALADKNIKLVIALLPSKARAYQDKLGAHAFPAGKLSIYEDTVKTLRDAEITTVDLMPVFKGQESFFLKTDTHWTSEGASAAAKSISVVAKEVCASCDLGKDKFASTAGETKIHDGDLLRYIPVSDAEKATLMQDKVATITTDKQSAADGASAEDNLFGDETFPVVLVGTSYSANPLFNFAGYLQENLGSDVLNAADEGQGPFVTMKAWRETLEKGDIAAPKLVVWEIPERYLTIADIKPVKE